MGCTVDLCIQKNKSETMIVIVISLSALQCHLLEFLHQAEVEAVEDNMAALGYFEGDHLLLHR